jgi:hypothetical protein
MALMLAAMSLFTARPAAAINCANVSNPLSWPYGAYTKYCGSATFSDGENVANVLNTFLLKDSSSGNKTLEAGYLLTNVASLGGHGAHFFVFGTQSEFSNAGGTGYCNVHPSVFGYASGAKCPIFAISNYAETVVNVSGTTGSPQYTVLFKSAIIGTETIQNAAAHEAGHWLDYLSAYKTLLGSSVLRASDSKNFNSELNHDWSNLNKYTPCISGGGVFTGQKDSSGNWICANNGSGPGLAAPGYSGSNQQVLQKAWAAFFNPATYLPATNKEFFAEEVAVLTGNSVGPVSPDHYFINSEFLCTRTLVFSLMVYGQIPGRTGSIQRWPAGQGCPSF